MNADGVLVRFNPVVVSYPTDRLLDYGELLPHVLAALPPVDPFILFGESFSGPLAVMVAARRPVNLIGVVLCATFVTAPMRLPRWFVGCVARSMVFRLFPAGQRVKALLGRYSNPRLQQLFSQVHARVGPKVIAFRVRRVFTVDVRDELRSIEKPVLCIAAEHDRVVPGRNLRLMQKLKPDVAVVIIAAPHGIPQTRPVEVADAIESFAGRCIAARVSGRD